MCRKGKTQKSEEGKNFQEKRIDGCLTLLDIPISEATKTKGSEKGKSENYDRIELSSGGCSSNNAECSCEISEEEKVANRQKIDFCGGLKSYSLSNKEFTLADGTMIPGWQTIDMLSCLAECGALGLYLSYSRKAVNALLDYMGFKPGKIEIGVEGGRGITYCWTPKGELWDSSEINDRIDRLNALNLYERGYPPGSAIVIEGTKYPLDDQGFVHVPRGVPYCEALENLVSVVDKEGNIIYPKKNKRQIGG